MVMFKAVSSVERRKRTAAVFSLYLFLSATPSFARISEDFGEADELLLFQDMTLVVSASRQKQPENLLSVPVSVLTAADLHYGGQSSIQETLRYAPGVDVVRMDRNRYGIGIHGLEGMFSDRTMTLVDGMPADSPAFGGPEFSSLPIMVEDIERIEIVRGSGGAAWGANALSGVINIITKDPETVPGLFLSSTVSQFGDGSSQARYADVSGKWQWLLSAGYEDLNSSSDVLDLSANEGGEDFKRRTLARGELLYTTESELEITFGAGMTGTDQGAFETAGISDAGANGLNTANGYIKAEKMFSSTMEGYFRWAGRYQDMDRPSYGAAEYQVLENDFEAQINMTGLASHSVAFGGNFRSTDISTLPLEPNVFTLAEEDVSERWFGLFASDRYQYSKKLFFEAQLRGDYFSEGETDWSGRLSSIYGVDSLMDHVVRISAAKSYRQPVGFIRNAIFYNDPRKEAFDFQFSVDPDMQSEQAWSLEGGYHWNINDAITFKTDLYYMWYENLIGGRAEYGVNGEGLPTYHLYVDNTGDAEGYGVEVELDYESGPLQWSIWYAFNEFETEFWHQSIRSFLPARNKVGINLRWKIDSNWTFNGQYAYSDPVDEDVSDYSIESSNHLDLTISRGFMEKKGELMFGVMDLLKKEYDPVVGLDQTSSHPIPGRMFFCRLQFVF